jgi:hypothetical protein
MPEDVIGDIPAESCGGSVKTDVVPPDVSESRSGATPSEETPKRLAAQRLAEFIYRMMLEEESTAATTPFDTVPIEPVGVDVGN